MKPVMRHVFSILLMVLALPVTAQIRNFPETVIAQGPVKSMRAFDLSGIYSGLVGLPDPTTLRWRYDDGAVPGHLYMSRGGEAWQEMFPGSIGLSDSSSWLANGNTLTIGEKFQYNVKRYGAKGNGVSTPCLVDGSGHFYTCANLTNSDAGKIIQIPNAVSSAITANLVSGGDHITVNSSSIQTGTEFHTWNTGQRLTFSSNGILGTSTVTYQGAPYQSGTIIDTGGAGFTGSNETSWTATLPDFSAVTGLPATNASGKMFVPVYGTISGVDGSHHVTLTGASGTEDATANWTENAWVATDDSAAVTAAVTAAGAGGTIFFPEGNFFIQNVNILSGMNVVGVPGATHIIELQHFVPTNNDYGISGGIGSTDAPFIVQGTPGVDDPYMAKVRNGAVPALVTNTGGTNSNSLVAGTTYYYAVSADDFPSTHHSALSSTTQFVTTDSTNKTADITVKAYPSTGWTRLQLWRADGFAASNGARTWKKLGAPVPLSGFLDQWTDGDATTLAFVDDGSVTPTAATVPRTNTTYVPVSHVHFSGLDFIGNYWMAYAIKCKYASDVQISDITASGTIAQPVLVQNVDTGFINDLTSVAGGISNALLENTANFSIRNSRFDTSAETGILIHHGNGVPSTLNPLSHDNDITSCQLTNWGKNGGSGHNEGIIYYGSYRGNCQWNIMHDGAGLGSGYAIRIRDSPQIKVTGNKIYSPKSIGISVTSINDFRDQNYGYGTDTVYDDGQIIGGDGSITQNTVVGAQGDGILVGNESFGSGLPYYSDTAWTPAGGAATSMTLIGTTGVGVLPELIEGNTILNSGVYDYTAETMGMEVKAANCIVRGNTIRSVGAGGISLAISNDGNGHSFPPNDCLLDNNYISDLSIGSNVGLGDNLGILVEGLRDTITNNHIVGRTSGSASGTGIQISVGSLGADVSYIASGNVFSNLSTNMSVLTAASHITTALPQNGGQVDFSKPISFDYTMTPTDHLIPVYSDAAHAVTLLPVANLSIGQTVIVADWKGTAATNNITITPGASDQINNGTVGASIVINANNGVKTCTILAANKWICY